MSTQAELTERELIEVDLYVVDILAGTKKNLADQDDVNISNPITDQILVFENGVWVNRTIVTLVMDAIVNETPTPVNPLPSKVFQTSNDYDAGTMNVFLNGMKIHDSEVTKVSDNQFSLPIDVITEDMIEVSYIRK